MAGKKKEVKETNVEFAKGGDGHMFGPQKAGQEASGTTAHDVESGGRDKYACGGKTKMFGYAGAVPQQAGRTSAR